MMMLVPEAWENNMSMGPEKRAFYEYQACLMEPWDGPAALPFSDGRFVGAILDRNGLRPCRYLRTKDDLLVLSSEAGVLDFEAPDVLEKGRVRPGEMFLVDLERKRILSDKEIKQELSSEKAYGEWTENILRLDDIEGSAIIKSLSEDERSSLRRAFGYTLEDLKFIMKPMAQKGKEALGSMGNDTPLAVLSDQTRPLYDYFKQLFAQVTNPPLDAIREELVTSMTSYLGRDSSILEDGPQHCQKLKLKRPILSNEDLAAIRSIDQKGIKSKTISLCFPLKAGSASLKNAILSYSIWKERWMWIDRRDRRGTRSSSLLLSHWIWRQCSKSLLGSRKSQGFKTEGPIQRANKKLRESGHDGYY